MSWKGDKKRHGLTKKGLKTDSGFTQSEPSAKASSKGTSKADLANQMLGAASKIPVKGGQRCFKLPSPQLTKTVKQIQDKTGGKVTLVGDQVCVKKLDQQDMGMITAIGGLAITAGGVMGMGAGAAGGTATTATAATGAGVKTHVAQERRQTTRQVLGVGKAEVGQERRQLTRHGAGTLKTHISQELRQTGRQVAGARKLDAIQNKFIKATGMPRKAATTAANNIFKSVRKEVMGQIRGNAKALGLSKKVQGTITRTMAAGWTTTLTTQLFKQKIKNLRKLRATKAHRRQVKRKWKRGAADAASVAATFIPADAGIIARFVRRKMRRYSWVTI